MKWKTRTYCAVALALGLLAGVNAFGQDADAIKKARKLRAEAAYQQMKGNNEAALKSYTESLKYVKDPAIEKKIAALGGGAVKAATGGDRSYAGEVYSRLDIDGELLAFFSAEKIIEPVREELKTILEKVKDEVPEGGEGDMIKMIMEQVDPALEWLGLYTVQGLGLSLAQQGDGSYNYKEYLLGSDDRSDTALWKLMGKPVSQDMLAYMPADTAAFAFSAVGVNTLWDVVLEGAEKFGGEQAKEMILQQVDGLQAQTGIDVQSLIQSINDQWALAVMLDANTKIKIPLGPGQELTVPEPGMMIALDVEDDTILATLLAFLEAQGAPIKEKTIGDDTLYSVAPPQPMPVPFEPAIIVLDKDLLLFASHPSVIEAALESKKSGGAMLKSADFKKAFADMPEKINGAFYASQLLSETIVELQDKVFKDQMISEMGIGGNEAALAMAQRSMEKMAARKDNRLAMYVASDDDGIFAHCSMYTSGMNPIAESVVAPLGLIAAAGMSELQQAQQNATVMGCMSNARQLDMAKAMWQLDTGAEDGTVVTMEQLSDYIEGPITCPNGGTYILGVVGEEVTCSCSK